MKKEKNTFFCTKIHIFVIQLYIYRLLLFIFTQWPTTVSNNNNTTAKYKEKQKSNLWNTLRTFHLWLYVRRNFRGILTHTYLRKEKLVWWISVQVHFRRNCRVSFRNRCTFFWSETVSFGLNLYRWEHCTVLFAASVRLRMSSKLVILSGAMHKVQFITKNKYRKIKKKKHLVWHNRSILSIIEISIIIINARYSFRFHWIHFTAVGLTILSDFFRFFCFRFQADYYYYKDAFQLQKCLRKRNWNERTGMKKKRRR